MNTVDLIRRKRDGGTLTREEWGSLIDSFTDGKLPEYQMSAFLMACYFRGMSREEMLTFADRMLHSGVVLDLSDIPGYKVDKHSTGGVGDKVSLILAPIAAACGVAVPMISGRGLGHTGGTLDKLESIPGFRTSLTIAEYKEVLRSVGAVLIGQTTEIAPADKKMYALRDVTATVECIPLIAGSIMSKKLAEGSDALVLDIKTGRGAFMKKFGKALELGKALVEIGESAGKRTIGYVTDMSQPLGSHIGNWLEVVESVMCLRTTDGKYGLSTDVMDLTLLQAGTMVMLSGKARTVEEGMTLCKATLADGTAYTKFLDIVRAQGGSVASIERLDAHPPATHQIAVSAFRDGFVQSIDAMECGLVSILLGAGRTKMEDRIDPVSGIVLHRKRGMSVRKGDPLATAYTNDPSVIPEAASRLGKMFVVGLRTPQPVPLVKARIDSHGVKLIGSRSNVTSKRPASTRKRRAKPTRKRNQRSRK